jgi:hypothetical protein
MRLIALAIGQAPMLTTATFELLQTGLDHGILMGLLFVDIRRLLPGGLLVKGALFGVLLFALACVPFVLPFLGELPAAPVLATGLFAALFLAMGIAEAATVAWLERRLPAPRRSLPSLVGYGLLAGLAVYTVLSFAINAVSYLLGELLPNLGG